MALAFLFAGNTGFANEPKPEDLPVYLVEDEFDFVQIVHRYGYDEYGYYYSDSTDAIFWKKDVFGDMRAWCVVTSIDTYRPMIFHRENGNFVIEFEDTFWNWKIQKSCKVYRIVKVKIISVISAKFKDFSVPQIPFGFGGFTEPNVKCPRP